MLWNRFLAYLQTLRLMLVIMLALMLMLMLVAFQSGEFGSLAEVLVWIIEGGGAAALVALFMAFLLENWPAWHNLPYAIKVIVPIALAAAVGAFVESVLGLGLIQEVPVAIRGVVLMLINYIFGQLGYLRLKVAGYGSKARAIAARK